VTKNPRYVPWEPARRWLVAFSIPKMVAGMLLVLDERGHGCVQTRAHGTSEWES